MYVCDKRAQSTISKKKKNTGIFVASLICAYNFYLHDALLKAIPISS